MPIKQVIMPPVRKLIRRGHRLEKSFAGETTLAPMFTLSVASRIAINEITTATGEGNRLSNCTGSQIAAPYIATVAEVTTIPITAYSVLVVSNARACTIPSSRWLRADRVKLG